MEMSGVLEDLPGGESFISPQGITGQMKRIEQLSEEDDKCMVETSKEYWLEIDEILDDETRGDLLPRR